MIDYKYKTREELITMLQELEQENISLQAIHNKESIDLKQIDNELLLSEEKYRLLAELSPEMIYLIDKEGYLLYCNSAAAAVLNLEPEILKGKHLTEIFPPEIAKSHLAQINDVFKNRQKIFREIEEPFSVGNVWIDVRLSPLLDEKGDVVVVLGLSNDITMRKREEKKLRESQMLFKTMVNDAPLGIALIDSITGKIYEVNSMFAKIAGRSLAEMAKIDLITITHPDDIYKDLHNMSLLVKGEINEFQLEKRYIRPDGFIVWISMTVSHLIKEEGLPLRHLCMIEDITERKKSEELIEMLKKSIDIIPVGAYWLNIDFNFVYINEAGCQLLGYSNEELIGKSLMKVNPSVTMEVINQLRELLIRDGLYKNESIHRRKDGYEFPVEISTTYVRYADKEFFCGIATDITERKRANEELREKSKYSRNLIEASLDPLVTISNLGKITDVNHSTEKVTGIPRDQLIGSDFSDYFTDPVKAREGYNQVFKLGFVRDYPLSIKHLNGQITDVLYNASLYQNEDGTTAGVFAAARDITDRKRIEESLLKSERNARALLDAMPDLMFKINSEGVFLDYKAEKENLAYQSESIIGLKVRDIMPLEFAELVEQNMRQVFQSGDMQLFEYNLRLPIKGVREFEARMVGCSVDEVVIVVRDITERKRTELEIVVKNEELHRINAEKDKFFSILAHDLRGPFNGFLGLTEIIAKELHHMTLDEIQELAFSLNNSAMNLYNLLGNLLEWSRIQRGLIHTNPVSFLLLPRISESLTLIVEAAAKKKIDFMIDVSKDIIVFTDPNSLEGIIRNLANNAVKFTPKGGNVIVSTNSIRDNFVEVSVMDSGIGMSKQMIDDLFRLDANTSRNGTENEPSTGLGLIICKDLIEKLGGELHIESEEGKGSEFRFTIPRIN